MTQVVEALYHVKQGPTHSTYHGCWRRKEVIIFSWGHMERDIAENFEIHNLHNKMLVMWLGNHCTMDQIIVSSS